MKQNSILLLTLDQFGFDLNGFLDKLKLFEFDNNEHIILRSISESSIADIDSEMMDKINTLYETYFSKISSLFLSKNEEGNQMDDSNTNNKSKDNNSDEDYNEETTSNLNLCDVNDNRYDINEPERVNELYNYICSYCKFLNKKMVSIKHMDDIEHVVKKCNLDRFTVTQLVDLCYHMGLVKSDVCRFVLEKLHSRALYDKVDLSDLIHMFTKVVEFDQFNRFENVEKILLDKYKNDNNHRDEKHDNNQKNYMNKINENKNKENKDNTHKKDKEKKEQNYENEEKEEFSLGLKECLDLVVVIGRGRRTEVMLTDLVVENIKKYTNELELEQVSKILINLSKINYNNRSFIRHMSNILLTFIDEDSIIDPFIISDLIKSFGRFRYCNDNLLRILLYVLVKEEVLAEVQIHDLVTIFNSLSKLYGSGLVSGFINPNKVNIKWYLNVLSKSILSKSINSDMAISLINSSGKILYDNEKFLNSLIESVNLNEINNLSILYKLKINVDKLTLYYPELNHRIQELESNLNNETSKHRFNKIKNDNTSNTSGSTSSSVNTDSINNTSNNNKEESTSKECKEDVNKLDSDNSEETNESKSSWDQSYLGRDRDVYIRRNLFYNNYRMSSVRKRKWTY